MPDRILKPDSGNDLILQNDDASAKIEINEDGSMPVTGTLTGSVDVSGGSLTTSSAQKQAIVQAGPGSGTLDVSSGTLTTSTAQKTAIVDGGKGNLAASDVGLGNVTNESKGTMFTSPTFTGTPNLGSNPHVTLGNNATFPAGHIVQSVLNPTISGASNTNHFTSEGVAAQLDGQITIASGNGVLIYFCALLFLDRASDDCGFLMKLREGLTTSGALITDHQERFSSGQNVLYSRSLWGFDASPASTTPDYCITLQRYTSGINFVEINDTSSQFLKAFLFEVKQ